MLQVTCRHNRFEDCVEVLRFEFTGSDFLQSLFYAVERGKEPCDIREVDSTPNQKEQHKARFKGVCGLWADCSDEGLTQLLEWVGTHTCMSMFDIRRVYGGENQIESAYGFETCE